MASDDTQIASALNEFVPDVVGITAITCTYPMAVAIARAAKSLRHDLPVVMGGHHVTFTVEQTLAERSILLGSGVPPAEVAAPVRAQRPRRAGGHRENPEPDEGRVSRRQSRGRPPLDQGALRRHSGTGVPLHLALSGTSVRQALEVSALLRSRSILQIWYLMIGSGDELDAPATLERNVASLASFPFDLLQVSLLTPFPGTPLYERLKREGRLLDKGWEYYDGMRCVYRPSGMSPERLEGELVRAYKRIFVGSGARRLSHTLASARSFLFHTVSFRKLIKMVFRTVILLKDPL